MSDTPQMPRGTVSVAPAIHEGFTPNARDIPAALGRFEIRRLLGEGAFGRVFEAFDPSLKRQVALKVAKPEQMGGPARIERFRREAQAAGQLQHPHIVAVFDHGEEQGLHYIASAFIDGTTLEGYLLKRQSPLPWREAADLVRKLADALGYAHERRILHRDVKPANVLLRGDGTPLLADFGLAARLDEVDKLTRAGAVIGTPAYMAPEQFVGKPEPASDQYGLGCLFYELLTGQVPFGGADLAHYATLHTVQAAPSPRTLRADVPRDVEAICLKTLEKDPARRYADCGALAEDLRRVLAGEVVQARLPGPLERLGRWARRNPAVAGLLTSVVVLTIVGGLLVTWQWQRAVSALARADQARSERALGQVMALRDAAPGAVPLLLVDLQSSQAEVLPRLRQLVADTPERAARMRLGLALLPVEPEVRRDELLTWLLEVDDPAEVLLIRKALSPWADALSEPLWKRAEDAREPASVRLRAAVALAAFDPASPRWAGIAQATVEEMLLANPLHLGHWVQGLSPVRAALLPPLGEVFRGKRLERQRLVAARVLTDYAVENAEVVEGLLLEADAEQYAQLRPLVQRHRDWLQSRLQDRLREKPELWRDAPLDPAWRDVPAEVRQQIEQGQGLIAERWALCPSLPLDRVQAVCQALRPAGYRPVRVRPWGEQVAVVWTRDGGAWRLDMGLTAEQAKARHAEASKAGLVAEDVAGYETKEGERFALLLRQGAKEVATTIYLGVPAEGHGKQTDSLRDGGWNPARLQAVTGKNGLRYSGVWERGEKALKGWNVTWASEDATQADAVKAGERVAMDVTVTQEAASLLTLLATKRAYVSIWDADPTREATSPQGLSPEAHRTRSAELAEQGWRPVSLGAVAGKTPLVTSIWHRPVPPRTEVEALARKQATAGVTLMQLEKAPAVWPLWRHSPDPTLRSHLVHRARTFGVEARLLVSRLEEEKDVSVRRALIVALGEYSEKQLPAEVRAPLVKKLLGWYRDDPDAGIHGAIDWLLRHGNEGPEKRPLDWGQAKELERIDAELARDGERCGENSPVKGWIINSQRQTFTRIKGPIEFRMGSPLWEPGRIAEIEIPHIRVIPRSYRIATKPVTVAQWQQFLKERPDIQARDAKQYSPAADCPMIRIDMYQAMEYCNWLSEKEKIPEKEWVYPRKIEQGMKPLPGYLSKKGYRLLTEAEWEYAARAGATTSRNYGTDEVLLARHAWYLPNSRDRTWPVGQKRPNDLGLCDMHGNVWTWCQDLATQYPSGRGRDKYHIEDTNSGKICVLRGGSFFVQAPDVRCAYRFFERPDDDSITFGLRPASTLP